MNLIFRRAIRSDVPYLVKLIADDEIAATREKYEEPIPPSYYLAFDAINSDKNNFLMVAELDGKVVGTLQLTFITYLTYQGGKRALIEGVCTDKLFRGKGIGKNLLEWAIQQARNEGCHLVQLTTDKKRPDALKFYKKMGFHDSHEGLKLHL